MLDQRQFQEWSRKLNFTTQAESLIQQIRSSAPSRRVQGRRGNVSGRYPSRKMGVTIQFESHRNELAAIYELEHDPAVIEMYDQPPAIKLNWETATGKQVGIWHTPDYFVIRTDSAGYEECYASRSRTGLLGNRCGARAALGDVSLGCFLQATVVNLADVRSAQLSLLYDGFAGVRAATWPPATNPGSGWRARIRVGLF
jgi:hypothetical protein